MRKQQQQALRFPSGWGGRREGAGRRPSPDSGMPHLSRERFASRHPCHVTFRVREDVPSLRSVRFVREFERSVRQIRCHSGCRVVQYSIQGNHVHMLVEAAGPDALGRGMKSVGARLARAVNRVFRRRGPVLADRYHARVLKTPLEVRNALAYVLLNAHRHAGRRAKQLGTLDPASSGRWFEGWRRPIGPARDAPAVARAHTWLILKGWRRHGLIGLDEIPARA
ncbi:MAG: transposase [Deltaproteobacteria bacterium]|nr:transposase [Deltaproteobacteria bacterium]